MNAISGGPNWSLTGWKNGQPQIDFGDMDRYFALLRQYGLTSCTQRLWRGTICRSARRLPYGTDGGESGPREWPEL